ncbi:MAG: alpha/beta hydrolase [Planctomycetota bacterium]
MRLPPAWHVARRADGVEVPYRVEGDGPVLLLVPGLGGSSRLFGTLPRTLARLGWRAVAYDPPGLGHAADHAGEWSFDDAAEDLAAILAALDAPTCRLLATSMGGKVAAVFMARHADRVEEAFFYGTEASGSARARAVYGFWAAVFGALPPEDIFPAIRPFLFGSSFQRDKARLLDDIGRSFAPTPAELRTTRQQVRALSAAPFPALLAEVTRPVTCHAGLEDVLVVPADVRATAELLPGGRYVEVPEAGHTMLLENPEACLAVLGR